MLVLLLLLLLLQGLEFLGQRHGFRRELVGAGGGGLGFRRGLLCGRLFAFELGFFGGEGGFHGHRRVVDGKKKQEETLLLFGWLLVASGKVQARSNMSGGWWSLLVVKKISKPKSLQWVVFVDEVWWLWLLHESKDENDVNYPEFDDVARRGV